MINFITITITKSFRRIFFQSDQSDHENSRKIQQYAKNLKKAKVIEKVFLFIF